MRNIYIFMWVFAFLEMKNKGMREKKGIRNGRYI